MKQEVLDKLNAAFDVKIKPGKGGYKYIDSKDVIDRMNTVFKGSWSTIVVYKEIIEDHVLIEVMVRAYDEEINQWAEHSGFGSSQIARFTYGDNKGKPIDIGNIYKGALSKAIRSACARLGAGLYLEEDAKSEDVVTPSVGVTSEVPVPMPAMPTTTAPVVEEPVLQKVPAVEEAPAPVAPAVTLTPAPTVAMPVEEAPVQEVVSVPELPTVPVPNPVVEAPPEPASVPEPAPVPVSNSVPATPAPAPAGTPSSPIERIKNKKEQGGDMPVAPAVPAVPPETGARMVSDVQLAALEGVLSVKGMEYKALGREAFDDSNLTDDVPNKKDLTYNQAVVVIKYGNEKNRRSE